jgi:dTDP-4-amino-4,6-dideoxygalactose transaminase
MKMIPLFKVNIPSNIGQKLQEVFDTGLITEGIYSDEFEKNFNNFIEAKYTGLVNSGTSALTLAYIMSGVKPGTEVISTPMTCMATNEPINTLGAKIVWADIDPKTGNLDPEDVRRKITSKTKAIVGVHWAGMPFDIQSINDIAKQHGIKVIEDAAHALGAKYKGKTIGSHSDYVCFSFQAIKHLTTVDGGAITCNSEEEYTRLKKLRWFGLDRKFKGSKWTQDITESGYKFHMNNINAAIGLEQLKTIQSVIDAHKQNHKYYDEHITNLKIKKMLQSPDSESSCWIYTVLTPDREHLQKYLLDKGIASDVVHVRNDTYSVFNDFRAPEGSLKGCDEFCSQHLNIPVGWWLADEEKKYIVDTINNY